MLSQSRFKTVHTATTYNFCSQNCLNSFQSTKKQKSKYKSKNGMYTSTLVKNVCLLNYLLIFHNVIFLIVLNNIMYYVFDYN